MTATTTNVLPYSTRRAIVRPGERLVVARRGNAAVLVRGLGPFRWKLHHDERAAGRPETYTETGTRRPQRDIGSFGWRGGVGNSGSDFGKLEPGHLLPDHRGTVSQYAARPRVRPQGGVHLLDEKHRAPVPIRSARGIQSFRQVNAPGSVFEREGIGVTAATSAEESEEAIVGVAGGDQGARARHALDADPVCLKVG